MIQQDRSPGENWAGNYTYRAQKLHRPSTIEQAQEIIANVPHVRVLSSRHSFNDVADSSELITLEALPRNVVVDHEANTVSINAAMTYGELVEALRAEEVALHNLATAVAGLEVVTSGGEIVEADRGEADFDGLVVGLGALGALTRTTLEVEPAYEARQRVFEDLSWEALYERFDEITSCAVTASAPLPAGVRS
jgi:xylitol oxidase